MAISGGPLPALGRRIRNALLFLAPTLAIGVAVTMRPSGARVTWSSLVWPAVGGLAVLTAAKWLVDTSRFRQIVQVCGGGVSFWRGLEVFLASIFGSNITPLYVGGIATQVYFLTQVALGVGRSAAIGSIYALLNLLVNTLFSLAILASPSLVTATKRGSALVATALVMFLVTVAVVLAVRFRTGVERAVRNLLRSRPAAVERVVSALDDFYDGFRLFATSGPALVARVLLLSLLSQALSLLYAPLAFRAVGMVDTPAWQLVLTQAGVQFTNSVGVTPGGIGIIDGAFALFFRPFAREQTAAVTLVWRASTYYVPTIVGAVFFFVLLRRQRPPPREDSSRSENR
jgi:uncharacterized protein (TIRG00374 family)